MQTRPYGELFKLVQSLAGVRQFAHNEQDDIANCINRRLQEAYQTSQVWPRYLVPHEARTIGSFAVSGGNNPAASGNMNQVYGLKEPINSKDSYRSISTDEWECQWTGYSWELRGPNNLYYYNTELVDQPWQAKRPWMRGYNQINLYLSPGSYVPYEQANRDNAIGEFIRLHRGQPFVNDSRLEYDFYVTEYGAQIINLQGTQGASDRAAPEVFVSYKKQLPLLTTKNNFAESVEPVPLEFFYYIAHTAYADFLRLDGQTDKAFAEESRGQGYLNQELERVETISNNNFINSKFTTYVSRQAR